MALLYRVQFRNVDAQQGVRSFVGDNYNSFSLLDQRIRQVLVPVPYGLVTAQTDHHPESHLLDHEMPLRQLDIAERATLHQRISQHVQRHIFLAIPIYDANQSATSWRLASKGTRISFRFRHIKIVVTTKQRRHRHHFANTEHKYP